MPRRHRYRHLLLRSSVLTALIACQGKALAPGASSAPSGDDSGTEAADAAAVGAAQDAGATEDASILLTLPIGDGKYLAYPQQGYVFSCQQTFGGIGGASVDGPWIHLDAGTFDFLAKVVVEGAVSWPTRTFDAGLGGATRTVTGNELPVHSTGTFPIATTDPAYAYDQNPNSIEAQTLSWALPATPTVAASPTCLGGGPIGVMLTGAVLYDALDGEGRDALAHEAQDSCQAHPQPTGEYHYHSLTECIADPGTGHSALLGYARDGFGIYGRRGENGETLTNADLDECHGHTHAITWDGATVTLYHYHATYEFPYTLGCFRGTPVAQ
ncbi:MAG: YHYH protein [Polyangiaceae bacterium]